VATPSERKARRRVARATTRLATWLATLAVFVQLLVLPYHLPPAQNELDAVAAELKATFGPTAVLCTQRDDSSAPGRQYVGCDVGCPLCQFASHAALLEAPPPALPERLAIIDGPPLAPSDFVRPLARTLRFAQPRAPPSYA
jgi:hypothetical protein